MRESIRSVVDAFADAFDAHDWEGLTDLLADPVEIDYTDMRGEKETQSRKDYVDKRAESLGGLDMLHVFSNHEVAVEGTTATCSCDGRIERHRGDRFFHTDVRYRFGLENDSGRWRIRAIRQQVLASEGDPAIHSGRK